MRGRKRVSEDDNDGVVFYVLWKHMLFSLLLNILTIVVAYFVFKNIMYIVAEKTLEAVSEKDSMTHIMVSKDDSMLLRKRYMDLVNLDGTEIDNRYLSPYSNVKYCIGDVVETDFANFQIMDITYEDLDEYFNRAKITFLVENKGMYGGIKLTENTAIMSSDSPKIVANVTNKAGGVGLNLSRDYTDTLINKGSTVKVVGELKIRKTDNIESLLIGFDKNVGSIRQVDCTLKLKDMSSTRGLREMFNPYVETGVIRASDDDTVYLDKGVSVQVLGKYYRSKDSKFKEKPYKDKTDIGIEVKITNNSDDKIPIAERFNFVLIDSLGRMHKEVIYSDVLNIVNNTYDRPVLDKGESIFGYINFEAYDDFNHRLLISERKHIVPYGMPIYNSSTDRQDTSYMVAIKLPAYGWSSERITDIEKSFETKKNPKKIKY